MKKSYMVEIKVDAALLQQIDKWLTTKNPEEFQGEDHTVSVTAVFPDGCQMDVKCCGCQDESSWTEAVLFTAQGGELCCTDPAYAFKCEWELEHDGVKYTAIITEK